MILINRIGSSITGNYGEVSFGIPFSKEKWDTLNEIVEQSTKVKKVADLKKLYEQMKELTTIDYKESIETECPDVFVNQATGKFYLKVGSKVSSVEMPKALVDRLLASLEKGIDIDPLIKLWSRWLRNPILRKLNKNEQIVKSSNMFQYINATWLDEEKAEDLISEKGLSEEVAQERSTVYQVKITQEGLLCTYKVSREITEKYSLDDDGERITIPRYKKTIDEDTGIVSYDEPEHVEDRLFEPVMMGTGGDPFYCEGESGYLKPEHFIKVGCNHRLEDWSQVNTNDNQSCVKGLHVGGLKYINGYQHDGTVTHNVFVDPMHVGAIPSIDYGDGAIRCLQYFVHSSFGGVNGSIYHSSEYASKTDSQWNDLRKNIIKDFGEINDSFREEVGELNEL